MCHKSPIWTLFFFGCFSCLAAWQSAQAQDVATGSDGRKIVLHEDGTWTYLTQIDSLKGHFRSALWGMSQDAVRGHETWTLVRAEPHALTYSGTIADLKLSCTYFFKADRLVGAEYVVHDQNPKQPDSIAHFKTLTQSLKGRYGDPELEKQYWKDIRFKYDYASWGLAVSMGHLSFYSRWQTNETRIVAYLNGTNYQINLGIEYLCRDAKLIDPTGEKQALLENF